jgi:thiol-disulfide isomerase/thioredoxin
VQVCVFILNEGGSEMTTEIIVLTAPGCTTCDQAKAVVQKFVEQAKREFPGLSYRTIDVVASPDIGARYGVLSTPSIIINDELAFRGVPQEKALRKKLASLGLQIS